MVGQQTAEEQVEPQTREEMLDELAPRVYTCLQTTPQLTVEQLAGKLEAKPEDIEYILHSYLVVDGEPRHEGPGQGGNWIPEEIRAELVSGYEEPEFIGHRWPDGSLNMEEPFDLENPEHLARVGLKKVE